MKKGLNYIQAYFSVLLCQISLMGLNNHFAVLQKPRRISSTSKTSKDNFYLHVILNKSSCIYAGCKNGCVLENIYLKQTQEKVTP